MTILALDLGTKTGWAHVNSAGKIHSATALLAKTGELKAAKEEHFDRRFDIRFVALWSVLDGIELTYGKPDLIFFEDVLFSEFTLQTQLWASLRAAVWAYRYANDIRDIECLNTSGLKKFAGHGAATKKMMAAFLLKRFPEEFRKMANPQPAQERYIETVKGKVVESDEVDARHLLDYAMNLFSLCPTS